MENQSHDLAPLPSYPSTMVDEIAQGLREPADIAYGYGIARSEYDRLAHHKGFLAAVATRRAEYERGGQTIKLKAQLMTEHLMDDLFVKTRESGTLAQLQDSIKILSKLGDLEPRNTAAQIAPGVGFSISINLPQMGAMPATTIEMNQVPVIDVPLFHKDIENMDIDFAEDI